MKKENTNTPFSFFIVHVSSFAHQLERRNNRFFPPVCILFSRDSSFIFQQQGQWLNSPLKLIFRALKIRMDNSKNHVSWFNTCIGIVICIKFVIISIMLTLLPEKEIWIVLVNSQQLCFKFVQDETLVLGEFSREIAIICSTFGFLQSLH